MRKDLVRSARGSTVDFDMLIEQAKMKPEKKFRTTEVPAKIKEVAEKRKMSGHIPAAPVPEDMTPAEATQITVKKKKADIEGAVQ